MEKMDNFYKIQLTKEVNENEKDKMRIIVLAVEMERLSLILS